MDENNTPIDEAKLTKGQKKKLKEKQKKEAAAKAAAEGNGPEEAKSEPPPSDAASSAAPKGKGAKKGKKGGPSAAANAIKKKLQEQKEYQEELEREEQEIRRIAEAEQKAIEDAERKRTEVADRIEKERIAHIRELKKKGEWESKKDKAKREAMEDARRQLIEQGLVNEEDFAKPEDQTKQKIVYVSKKKKSKKNKNQQEDQKQEEESKQISGDKDMTKETKEADKKQDKASKFNVEAGIEESEDQVKKENNQTNEIDDELKVDDWEDLLDDDVANEQVKLQQDAAPKQEVIEEEESINQNKKETSHSKHDEEEEKKVTPSSKPSKGKKQATGATSIFDQGSTKKNKGKKGKKARQVEDDLIEDDGTKFRCPIVCVLGHVDTGKTLLLDKIRRTNVQRGEAGGITQQIGATYFPGEALQKNVDKLDDTFDVKEVRIPGLLVIDTPGHESFTNLRSRGSNLCDLAVLVVDIMHGLEKQTLESIDLLRKRKTPFIVALNKCDVVHSWAKEEYRSSKIALENQDSTVIDEYEMRRNQAFLQFNENGLNIVEYWKNEDPKTFISAVPTSAMTGEGIPDILGMIVKFTQKLLKNKITERNSEFLCTVLEVKKISGVGTTVDVVLVNGKLKVGDTIVLAGFNGPIVTKIRALLTPQPMKEIRVKGEYIHHTELYGAMGIKISAPELDYALAGGELYKAKNDDEIDELCEEIKENMMNFAEKYVNPKEEGVCVQASTLGSLEALLEFLKTSKIPVCSINIGELFKKDVMKALKNITGFNVKKEFATILAFDVKIDKDAREYAEENGIKIFEADIIYHLFDQFTEYCEQCSDDRKTAQGAKAVFPCVLEIIQGNIFHKSEPILLGCNVKAGILKIGTPLCVPDRGMIKIGKVVGIQKGGKEVTKAREIDGGVSVSIHNEKHIMAGRNFDETNQLVSIISRDSIEALKEYFKDELVKDDWRLVVKLKKVFDII